jgi:RNA polymerase-binding transcription factor DksA
MNDNIKITEEELKIRLESEMLELKKEISDISIPDTAATGGYDAKETNTFDGVLDNADQASEMTDIHNNNAILQILEERELSVQRALDAMFHGKYGICNECGKQIEHKRLLINAAATACIEHMEM